MYVDDEKGWSFFGNMYKQTCNAFNQVISFYSLTYANFLTANRPKLYAFAVLHTAYTKSQKRLVNNCKIRELEFLLFVMIPLSSLVYDIFLLIIIHDRRFFDGDERV